MRPAIPAAGRRAVVVAVVALALAGCGGGDRAAEPSELRVALRADLPGTEPGVQRSAIQDDVLLHVVEGLVGLRQDLSVAPMLAERVDVSPDGRSYTFALRPDVRFHNGRPLDAAAVQWSWERAMRADSQWLCRNWYDGSEGFTVERVSAPDPATVVFELNEPSAVFLARLANVQCLFAVLHPDSVDAEGRWVKPIGTGPFALGEWRKGRHLVLEKFPEYASRAEPADGLVGAKAARVDRIRWSVIPDAAAARAALRSGQLDVVYLLDASDVSDLQRDPSVTVRFAPSLEKNVLLMSSAAPVTRDPRVRRAIAHAIDTAAAARAVTSLPGRDEPLGRANPSMISHPSRWHTAAQDEALTHDPARARALLQEAGYRGEKLVLQTNRRYPNMYDAAVVLQSMLTQAGLEVELQVLEWGTQLENYYDGRFQLMTFGFSGRTDPVFEYQTIVGNRERNPYVQWDDPQALQLLLEASRLVEPAQRQAKFDALHRLQLASVPLLPLFDHYVADAVGPRVVGYEPWAVAKPRFWNVSLADAR